jgi:hypothetical protein
MATYFTGADGALLVDGTEVAKIRNWSIAGSAEALETTTTGDNARTFIYGRQVYTGQCNALYYEDSAGALAMSSLLANIFRTTDTPATSTNTLLLQVASDRQVQATVLFTEATISTTAGQVVTAQLSFQVTGNLTTATIGG